MEQRFFFIRPFITLFVLLIFLAPSPAICQPPIGSISGIVTDDETSNPLVGVTISIVPSVFPEYPPPSYLPTKTATTDVNGEYMLTDVNEGIYWVRAEFSGQNYIAEFYNDTINSNEADKVWVYIGENTSGIDFSLAPGGMVSGKVVDSNGVGIADIGIFAFTGCSGNVLTSSVTDATGAYTLMGLPSGSVYLQADRLPFSNSGEWYDDATSCENASPVPVTIGSTTEDINFELEQSDDTSSIPITTDYTVVQLTDNDYDDQYPQINNNDYVVWSSEMMGTGEGIDGIFLYDGSSTKRLDNNDYIEISPKINTNGHVVWSDDSGNIYLYNGSTTKTISNRKDSEEIDLDSIQVNDNDFAVWAKSYFEYVEGDLNYLYTDIILYDGSTTKQITNNDSHYSNPQINNDGYVVYVEDNTNAIFLYDGTTTIKLSDGNTFWDLPTKPQINNQGLVVWQENDGSDYSGYEVFLYDGSTTTQLTDNDVYDGEPQINDNGDVVWVGGVDSLSGGSDFLGGEIFLYDGLQTTRLTNNNYIDMSPKINNNGHVVWIGRPPPYEIFPYEKHYEIFLFDGSTVTQITDNDINDLNPQIDDNDTIVWQGGIILYEPYEIFYAYSSESDNNDDTDDGGGRGCFIGSLFE